MVIPEFVKNIIGRLREQGHRAYAVGGCVRDSLLGRVPEDWDICSSALPEEVLALFGPDALPTGLKHGTVTVRSGGGKAEVTTFRIDGAYSDHRRPDSVRFSSSLTEDLARRDFCMNAMALGPDGELIDPFDGRGDIEKRLVRCVGEPARRFEEDALRMFRGLRFSAVLGFCLDAGTLAALYEKAPLARELAPERVRVELEKLLLADDLSPLLPLFDSGLMDAYSARPGELDGQPLAALPREPRLRWAGLCALLEQAGAANTAPFLEQLRCDRDTVRLCSAGVSAALNGVPGDRRGWKRLLSRIGAEAARCAAAAGVTLGHIDAFEGLEDALGSGECWCLKELAVRGDDLLALGCGGKETGAVLRRLLEHVIEVPEDNEKELLLEMAKHG
ncbi:MAG: CCA tRNA nucleotidyltransferase [Oscillospiraceae bacterium]